ncbi:ubiquitin carboxyl-terminal hydrolase 20 [Capsicum galapagoense]
MSYAGAGTHKPFGQSHFVCIIRPYCFVSDSLVIPTKFALANRLSNKRCDLIIRDERERSWNVKLHSSGNSVYIRGGCHEFRDANCLKEGDCIIFEVVSNGNTPIWKYNGSTVRVVKIISRIKTRSNGGRFEAGWAAFVEEHDLQMGDLLIFRHEGDMEFEVSIFDSSRRNREYAEYLQEEGGCNNVEETSKNFEFKDAGTHNPCDQSHFECTGKPYCISNGYLLRCCNCGHYSNTYEPLIDASLEVKDADSLHSTLDSFTRVEKLDDPEIRLTCEQCYMQVLIEKQLMLYNAHSVAVFHLKRFQNDGSVVRKVDKHVAFPLELDLLPYTENNQTNNEAGPIPVEMKHAYQPSEQQNHHFGTSSNGRRQRKGRYLASAAS